MADDIVTRLNEDRCCFPECHWLQTEAADEIERLRKLVLVEEPKLGDPKSEGYVRIHAYELGQLVKQANGSYNMMNDLNSFARDRNRWRATAEVLARELGKIEYADAEWQNQEGLH